MKQRMILLGAVIVLILLVWYVRRRPVATTTATPAVTETRAKAPVYCTDPKGGEYSEGAVRFDGRKMLACHQGQWKLVKIIPAQNQK